MAELTRDQVLQKIRRGEKLERADLRAVDLSKTQLVGVSLARADLEGANLEGAVLRKSNLKNASLTDQTVVLEVENGTEARRWWHVELAEEVESQRRWSPHRDHRPLSREQVANAPNPDLLDDAVDGLLRRVGRVVEAEQVAVLVHLGVRPELERPLAVVLPGACPLEALAGLERGLTMSALKMTLRGDLFRFSAEDLEELPF